ncbi:hypothetical protein [Chlamydiifrater phoenicopteri]|uniref:hypothetical protein n=1 Tax=Chlamydiifrater phoenicopteri TaxID=2681469 RepID=UPI001BCBE967|nr:hypothetical protein [Chlamydiifrater phoenicopteri]
MEHIFSFGPFLSSLEDCVALTEVGKRISVNLLLSSELVGTEKQQFVQKVRRIGSALQSSAAGMAVLVLGGSVNLHSNLRESFCEFSLDREKRPLYFHLSRLQFFRLGKDVSFILKILQRFFPKEKIVSVAFFIAPSLKEATMLSYFDFLGRNSPLSFQIAASYYVENLRCWKEFSSNIVSKMDGEIFGKILVGISTAIFKRPLHVLFIRLKENAAWISFREEEGNTRCVNLLDQSASSKWSKEEIFVLKQLLNQIFYFMMEYSGALEVVSKKNLQNPLVSLLKKLYAVMTGKKFGKKVVITFLPNFL